MRYANFRTYSRFMLAISILVALVSTAQADPITPSYTVTDLGVGTATLSTYANGNGIAIAPNGQTSYAFPQTPDTYLAPYYGIMSNFPLLVPVPSSVPEAPYLTPMSNVTSAVENANGLVLATDQYSVFDHIYGVSAYVVQGLPGGSWGQPVSIYADNAIDGTGNLGPNFAIVGINNANQILLATGLQRNYDAVVYNANTNTLIDLQNQVFPSYNWNNLRPIAIDDQGRILLRASEFDPNLGETEHTILLTP